MRRRHDGIWGGDIYSNNLRVTGTTLSFASPKISVVEFIQALGGGSHIEWPEDLGGGVDLVNKDKDPHITAIQQFLPLSNVTVLLVPFIMHLDSVDEDDNESRYSDGW